MLGSSSIGPRPPRQPGPADSPPATPPASLSGADEAQQQAAASSALVPLQRPLSPAIRWTRNPSVMRPDYDQTVVVPTRRLLFTVDAEIRRRGLAAPNRGLRTPQLSPWFHATVDALNQSVIHPGMRAPAYKVAYAIYLYALLLEKLQALPAHDQEQGALKHLFGSADPDDNIYERLVAQNAARNYVAAAIDMTPGESEIFETHIRDSAFVKKLQEYRLHLKPEDVLMLATAFPWGITRLKNNKINRLRVNFFLTLKLMSSTPQAYTWHPYFSRMAASGEPAWADTKRKTVEKLQRKLKINPDDPKQVSKALNLEKSLVHFFDDTSIKDWLADQAILPIPARPTKKPRLSTPELPETTTATQTALMFLAEPLPEAEISGSLDEEIEKFYNADLDTSCRPLVPLHASNVGGPARDAGAGQGANRSDTPRYREDLQRSHTPASPQNDRHLRREETLAETTALEPVDEIQVAASVIPIHPVDTDKTASQAAADHFGTRAPIQPEIHQSSALTQTQSASQKNHLNYEKKIIALEMKLLKSCNEEITKIYSNQQKITSISDIKILFEAWTEDLYPKTKPSTGERDFRIIYSIIYYIKLMRNLSKITIPKIQRTTRREWMSFNLSKTARSMEISISEKLITSYIKEKFQLSDEDLLKINAFTFNNKDPSEKDSLIEKLPISIILSLEVAFPGGVITQEQPNSGLCHYFVEAIKLFDRSPVPTQRGTFLCEAAVSAAPDAWAQAESAMVLRAKEKTDPVFVNWVVRSIEIFFGNPSVKDCLVQAAANALPKRTPPEAVLLRSAPQRASQTPTTTQRLAAGASQDAITPAPERARQEDAVGAARTQPPRRTAPPQPPQLPPAWRSPLKSIAGPLPRLTCPDWGPDDADAATGELANPARSTPVSVPSLPASALRPSAEMTLVDSPAAPLAPASGSAAHSHSRAPRLEAAPPSWGPPQFDALAFQRPRTPELRLSGPAIDPSAMALIGQSCLQEVARLRLPNQRQGRLHAITPLLAYWTDKLNVQTISPEMRTTEPGLEMCYALYLSALLLQEFKHLPLPTDLTSAGAAPSLGSTPALSGLSTTIVGTYVATSLSLGPRRAQGLQDKLSDPDMVDTLNLYAQELDPLGVMLLAKLYPWFDPLKTQAAHEAHIPLRHALFTGLVTTTQHASASLQGLNFTGHLAAAANSPDPDAWHRAIAQLHNINPYVGHIRDVCNDLGRTAAIKPWLASYAAAQRPPLTWTPVQSR
jgi:hypothetical protein